MTLLALWIACCERGGTVFGELTAYADDCVTIVELESEDGSLVDRASGHGTLPYRFEAVPSGTYLLLGSMSCDALGDGRPSCDWRSEAFEVGCGEEIDGYEIADQGCAD